MHEADMFPVACDSVFELMDVFGTNQRCGTDRASGYVTARIQLSYLDSRREQAPWPLLKRPSRSVVSMAS